MKPISCPLCDGEAHYTETSAPDGKLVTCQHCSEFWIDEPSERHLAGLPEVTRTERRRDLSQMSRSTPKERMFVIRKPVGEKAITGIKTQTKTLIAEYVKV